MTAIETHAIVWSCRRCHVGGSLPQLDRASIEDVRHAIDRGHERRAAPCHARCGITHVEAVQNGLRLRFGSLTQSTR